MTDKYCPLRFREYDSNPHDQRCIGEYCAWFDKCSQSHGEPRTDTVETQTRVRTETDTETAQEPRETAQDALDVDSREKLEAEILDDIEHFVNGEWVVTHETIADWLDRQAAITERTAVIAAKEAGKVLREKIAELQEKVEELGRENEKLKSELDARMYWVNLADRIDELEAENARLSSDELHWRSEADYYRSLYERMAKAVDDVARNYTVVDEGMA